MLDVLMQWLLPIPGVLSHVGILHVPPEHMMGEVEAHNCSWSWVLAGDGVCEGDGSGLCNPS